MEMSNPVAGDRKGLAVKVAIGVGAFAVALAVIWHQQSTQYGAVREELAKTKQSMERMRSEMETSVAASKKEASESIALMNEKMAAEVAAARKSAQSQAVAQAAKAQANAEKEAGKLIEEMNAKSVRLAAQLDELKKENETKVARVDENIAVIKTDVGAVRTEVANTRTELDKTIQDLKRVTGDMGVMSGLIATNATELDALRKLGERDYFEFTLDKTGSRKVAGIQLALKKADLKRNRFTLDVLADDRKVEKKDKTVNEPVQFYTSYAKMPFELVVNQIGKDKISGYLSVPKLKLVAQR